MVEKRISRYADAETLDGDEFVHVVQDGVNVKVALSAISRSGQFLTHWATARDSSTVSPADVVIIGDSISVLGSQISKPFGWLLGKALSQSDLRAETYGWVFASVPSHAGPDMDSCGGTPSATGAGGYSSAMAVNDTAQIVAPCDGISIVWTRSPGGGNIEVRDGGSGGTLITTINTAGAAAASQVTRVDLTTYASHTIHLKVVSAGVTFEGAYLHAGDQTAGTRVWTCGHAGYSTADYVSTPSLALDLIRTLDPDLVIIQTGFNDTNDTTYAADLDALINAVRQRSNASVAVMSPWGGSNIPGSAAKAAAAVRIAKAKRANLIDLFGAAGNVSNNVDPLDWSADGAHPKPGASVMISDLILLQIAANPWLIAATMFGRGPRDLVGTITNNQGSRGAASVQSTLGYPNVAVRNVDTDANDQLVLFTSGFATLLGLPGASIALGPGGASSVNAFISWLAANQIRLSGGLTLAGTGGAGYVDYTEQSSDPTAPAADHARVFVKDNGAGKTQLAVRFATGAVQVVATQP